LIEYNAGGKAHSECVVRVEGSVARITLNRPEKRNALNSALLEGLAESLKRAGEDESARVVVIGGAGQDFCAGMDIVMLRETADAGVLEHLESARKLADLYSAMRHHRLPVVAAVHGRALGGGCGLATACDVVLAAESAQFGYPEVNIGFVPAIVTSLLRRSVGEKQAFELLTRGEPIGAAEACRMGLVTRVYPDAEFESRVAAYVGALADKPASAIGLTKRLLHHIDGLPFQAALEAGVEINALARMTEDARRGFRSFGK
jgi:methylglutaconyl-CoA hydratase